MNDDIKSKKIIIRMINESIIEEELAIPLYSSHIEQALFWSGLTEKKQKK